MKKPRKSGNEDEDALLWQRVASTVNPYGKKAAAPKTALPKPQKPQKSSPPPLPVRAGPPPAFDRGMEEKLKKGNVAIEGSLDLHGMTQSEAYEALHRFIRHAVRAGKRTLLVITGKGRVGGGGVLRRQLPLWLEDSALKGAVLAFTPAKQKDGGEGAFYVRLRKSP